MRISKNKARQVANQMVMKKREVVAQLKTEYEKLVYSLYTQTLPEDVKKLWNRDPQYLNLSNSIRLDSHGFSRERVYFEKEVPVGERSEFKLTREIAKELKTAYNKYIDAEKETNALHAEIQTALLNLRTFANMEKHLPEAVAFFPNEISTLAVAVNYNKLRAKLQ